MREAVVPTIIGMAAVTYATRASGLYLGRRLRIPSWLEGLLRAMPSAIIVSLVAPEVVAAGVGGIVATIATALAAMAVRGNLVVPMAIGMLVDVAMKVLG